MKGFTATILLLLILGTTQSDSQLLDGLLGLLGNLPLLGPLLFGGSQSPQAPLLPILPNNLGIQLPLVGNVLNTATGLLGLAKTNISELLKLNLSISPLDIGNGNQFQCPSALSILAPDPLDCASFYICALGIVELKLTCAPGYHYEPGLLLLCLANDPKNLVERCNRCPAYKNPLNCTRSPYTCSFCVDKQFQGHRCDSAANLGKNGCSQPGIYNQTSGNETRFVDPYENGTNPVQFALTPGDKKNFTITFKLTSHPLDVYLLMDISGSMGDDKANVVQLSSKLTSFLANLTKDYTLGFGAFSDKVDAYTYRNILKLTNATANFSKIVDSTPMEGGGDFPEDAGTAMHQAAICEKDIGWRSFTRKLILVLTDATFHTAKDGSFNGVPFDGLCHLDATGIYTEKNRLDYPSIPQLVDTLAQHSITVIFGVEASQQAFYEDLAKQIKPSAVGVLSRDSSNLINLLDKEYRSIASRVEMRSSNVTKEILIKYYSTCADDGGVGSTSSGSTSTTTKPLETSTSVTGGWRPPIGSTTSMPVKAADTGRAICEGLPLEGEVSFTVEIGLSECPKDPADWKQTVKISAAGLPHYVEVPLELICRDFEK